MGPRPGRSSAACGEVLAPGVEALCPRESTGIADSEGAEKATAVFGAEGVAIDAVCEFVTDSEEE